MHSFLIRLNAVLCYAALIAAALAACNVMTTSWLQGSPNVSLNVTSLQAFVRHPNLNTDHARLTFDLEADLRSLFNWNTKQLFVYLVAEYRTSPVDGGPSTTTRVDENLRKKKSSTEDDDGDDEKEKEKGKGKGNGKEDKTGKGSEAGGGEKLNEVVLWDVIVQSKEQALISRRNEAIEYLLVDQGQGLRDNDVTFRIEWDRTPITGLLERTRTAETTVRFPPEYIARPYFFNKRS